LDGVTEDLELAMRDAFGVERVSKGVAQGARVAAKGSTLDGMLYARPRVDAHKMGRLAARLHRQALDAEREMNGEYVRAARWSKAKKYGRLKVREMTRTQLGSVARAQSKDALAENESQNLAYQTRKFKKKNKSPIQRTDDALDSYR
jgi:hypothetical protein